MERLLRTKKKTINMLQSLQTLKLFINLCLKKLELEVSTLQ